MRSQRLLASTGRSRLREANRSVEPSLDPDVDLNNVNVANRRIEIMRLLLAVPIVVAGLISTVAPADACSIRGRWCGYPLWAANAFEDKSGRVNPATGPVRPVLEGRRYDGPPRAYYYRDGHDAHYRGGRGHRHYR